MEQKKDFESTNFLTGLRAYAALAVFLIHSGGGGLRQLSWITNEIVEKGKYGVVSFFVISSFAMAMSIDKAISTGKFSYKTYLVRRWLRVFPVFFIIAFFSFARGGESYYLNLFHIKNNITNFLLQISLLNVLFTSHKNNLIGVEWTLPLEFFYYFWFPLIFFTLALLKKNIVAFTLVLIIAGYISWNSYTLLDPFYSHRFTTLASHYSWGRLLLQEVFNPDYRGFSDFWGILRYLFTFLSGFAIYFVYKSKKYKGNNFILAATIFLGSCLIITSRDHLEIIVTFFTCLLIISSLYRGRLVKVLFENPFIIHIGNISYSFYLTHLIIIEILNKYSQPLGFFISLIITIIISTIMYYFVEKPFITLGRRIQL